MDIVKEAENYVYNLFKDKLSSEYIYHNYNHTLRVVNDVKKILAAEGVKGDDEEALLLAAWFHDVAYVEGNEGHEARSATMAAEFLHLQGYPQVKAERVAQLIEATRMDAEPVDLAAQVLRDADCAHFADSNYAGLSELLREEWRLTQGKVYTDLEWAIGNRKMLLNGHRFYTQFGKEMLQPLKEKNITELQVRINALQSGGKKSSKDKLNKKKLEKIDRPDRGIDTMFRVTLNNHTRLSEIADSKANILLSVNAIIISIALTTLLPKLDSPGNAHLVTPTLILMSFSVVSIIFAILSTRPKVTSGTFTRDDIAAKKVNLLFFGNFYKVPLGEYEWAMHEMMKDRDYLYNSEK
ncbi:phosphohydrolase [Flavobacterium cyanobacteriorum]|uniref:Phosphohydrolase n=1 Tax=Flavobacterium cyanobacteriorum TaxID=2022802 RepID=A0A255Z782_9FLAO|nr:Pycsar system effector family protein [Flavobacterium cyanobacteriorum]OYQ37338.1 phosphohydrolase [Flavobacterium cyanobacteriorum]